MTFQMGADERKWNLIDNSHQVWRNMTFSMLTTKLSSEGVWFPLIKL